LLTADYEKLSALWDALDGTNTILLKIRKAIAVKISMAKGKLPVSSVVFGPEDLARYGAAIDKLSSEDEESGRPRRINKRTTRDSVNPDGEAFSKMMDASRLHAGETHPAPLPPRGYGRRTNTHHGHANAESGSSPIVGHRRRRRETSETPARHKRIRTATQLSRTPIPDSEATIGERSHDDSGDSSDGGDTRSSERYNQKQPALESELESELQSELEWGLERGSGRCGKEVSSDEDL
jgi:hypothetical protein